MFIKNIINYIDRKSPWILFLYVLLFVLIVVNLLIAFTMDSYAFKIYHYSLWHTMRSFSFDIVLVHILFAIGILILGILFYWSPRIKAIVQKLFIFLFILPYYINDYKTLVLNPHSDDDKYIKIFYDNEKYLKELAKQMPVDGCKDIEYPPYIKGKKRKILIKSKYDEWCYNIEQPPFQKFIKGKEFINLIGGDVSVASAIIGCKIPFKKNCSTRILHYGLGARVRKRIAYRPYFRVDRESQLVHVTLYTTYFENDENTKDIQKYKKYTYSNQLLDNLNGFLPDSTLRRKSCAYREIEPKWYIEACKEVSFFGGGS